MTKIEIIEKATERFGKSSMLGHEATTFTEINAREGHFALGPLGQFQLFSSSSSTMNALLEYFEIVSPDEREVQVISGGGEICIGLRIMRILAENLQTGQLRIFSALSCGCYYTILLCADLSEAMEIATHGAGDNDLPIAESRKTITWLRDKMIELGATYKKYIRQDRLAVFCNALDRVRSAETERPLTQYWIYFDTQIRDLDIKL